MNLILTCKLHLIMAIKKVGKNAIEFKQEKKKIISVIAAISNERLIAFMIFDKAMHSEDICFFLYSLGEHLESIGFNLNEF